jgi:DNA-binding response OmpR family regulator
VGGRILIAEDDPKQAELLRLYLEREHFSVLVAPDGRRALELARSRRPDLIVLDLIMPRLEGLDVCRILRGESGVPIIVISARSDEDDVLAALDLGADDYLTKPFSPRELGARVRAVLRRSGVEAAGPRVLAVGGLEVDLRAHEVRMDGELVDVTPREFAVLSTLAEEPGRAFSRAELIERAFGFAYEGLDRTVDTHVGNLRRKLERDAAHPGYVLTVFGVGYKLAEEAAA